MIYGIHRIKRRYNGYFIPLIILSQRLLAFPLQWRHNGRDNVSNHQPHDCVLTRLFRSRSKKTSKLRVTGLCAGNSPGTGEFPAQMASNAENVSIWWRHHGRPLWGQWWKLFRMFNSNIHQPIYIFYVMVMKTLVIIRGRFWYYQYMY